MSKLKMIYKGKLSLERERDCLIILIQNIYKANKARPKTTFFLIMRISMSMILTKAREYNFTVWWAR